MNVLDGFIVVLAAVLCVLGAFKGLIRVGIALGGLIGGILLAIRWEESATPLVRKVIDSDLWAPLLAFSGIVLVVVLIAVAVSILLRRVLEAADLLWIDRAAGAIVGLLAAIVLSAATSVFLAAGAPQGSRLLADSALAPWTLRASSALIRLAPPDLRRRFEEGLRRMNDRV